MFEGEARTGCEKTERAPTVTGGALSGGGGLLYRIRPEDDPPGAVVIVVVAAKQSLSMSQAWQMGPALVNGNLGLFAQRMRAPVESPALNESLSAAICRPCTRSRHGEGAPQAM